MKNLFLTALCLCVASVFIYNLKGPKGLTVMNSIESEVVKYNQLFPLHAQICARSVDGAKEEPAVFLKGACMGTGSTVGLCSSDNSSYEDGVGVSFNKEHDGAKVVMTKGRTTFFNTQDKAEYFCVKTPFAKEGFISLVEALNKLNTNTAQQDSVADFMELVFHKAGFAGLDVEEVGLVPSLLALLSHDRDLQDFSSAFLGPQLKAFPLHGVLLEHIGEARKFSFKEVDEKISNLESNLEYYSHRYDAIWKNRKDLNESFHEVVRARGLASASGNKKNVKEFTRLYKDYYKHIILKKQDADNKLNKLRSLRRF